MVLALGALVCTLLWQQQRNSIRTLAQERFERQAQGWADQLQQRMGGLSEVLYGVGNLLVVQPQLSRSQFERAAQQLERSSWLPGMRNLHFTRYVPARQRAAFEAQARQDAHLDGSLPQRFVVHPVLEGQTEFYVADFVWPLAGNAAVLGLNIHSQPANLQAIERARRTRALTASAPFELRQEQSLRTGVVLRVPVWHTDGQGQEHFLGAVGISVRLSDVLEAINAQGYTQGLAWQLSDHGWRDAVQAPGSATLMGSRQGPLWDADLQWQRTLEVGGRRWVLQAQPMHSFLSPTEERQPLVLALGGMVTTLLLAAQVMWWMRARQRERRHAQQLDQALQESEQRFLALFNQAAVGVAQHEFVGQQAQVGVGRLLLINNKLCEMLGYTRQEMHSLRLRDLNHPEDAEREDRLLGQLLSGQIQYYQFEKRYHRKNGQVLWVGLTVSMVQTHDPQRRQTFAVIQDIDERKRMEQALRDSETRLRNILSHIPVGVSLELNDAIVYRNTRYTDIIGYNAQQVPHAAAWWSLLVPDVEQRRQAMQTWQARYIQAQRSSDGYIEPLELNITTGSGQVRAVELSGQCIEGGDVIVLQDLTPRKAAEEEIRRLAYFDSLTQLPNRRLLIDRLAQAQALSVRNQQWGAVLMLDLDHFKIINDTQGPEQGDRLLCAVAQRLRACVHDEDTLARLGGDEFVLVMSELGDSAQAAAQAAEAQAQALLDALQEPLPVAEQLLHTSISIGISVFQGQGHSVDELLQRCDIAMYQAKTAGRNALRFYDPQMQVAVTEKAALEADMRQGLQQEQFVLYFQPQVDCDRIVGAEVLLRWQHPGKGFISPGQFIPLAESSNLIVPLGQWVIAQACTTLAQWASQPGLQEVVLAVNVSPRQFYEPSFVEQVQQALRHSGAPAQRLKLELTEGILLQDIAGTITKMEQLRALGVSFSLDDFGTGYSSLAYLKRLPLQELKIDQSFVRDVLHDANDAAIARTIIALGQSLNLQVTAEGVESEAQRKFLECSGCHAWQGYLLSPPVPLPVFEALWRRHHADQAI